MPIKEFKCVHCGESDKEKFYKRYKSRCKKCWYLYEKERELNNPEAARKRYEKDQKRYTRLKQERASKNPKKGLEYVCLVCGELEPNNFYERNKSRCKICVGEYQKNLLKTNSNYAEKRRAKNREWQKKHSKEIKQSVINIYGGKCECCGESEFHFLTIDHINNNGALERKTTKHNSLYRKIRDNGKMPEYQLLCINCNLGKHLNGGICPHKQDKTKITE